MVMWSFGSLRILASLQMRLDRDNFGRFRGAHVYTMRLLNEPTYGSFQKIGSPVNNYPVLRITGFPTREPLLFGNPHICSHLITPERENYAQQTIVRALVCSLGVRPCQVRSFVCSTRFLGPWSRLGARGTWGPRVLIT